MIDLNLKAGIRIRARAIELQRQGAVETPMLTAIIEEIERLNDVLRTHNLQ